MQTRIAVPCPGSLSLPNCIQAGLRLAAVLLACQLGPAWAEEDGDKTEDSSEVQAGHSYHGEVFNEGPRQSAYLMEGLGRVKFPVTTDKPSAQKFITQGVAQLHGFWYFEAERSFRQAAAIDPDCAMAYWGMAMSNRSNLERAKGFIAEAVERKEKTTKREKLYITALEKFLEGDVKKNKKDKSAKFIKAWENIIYEFPDDVEAKAFLIVQLWGSRSAGLPLTSHLAVDALIDQVFAAEPMHPAHHYRIHLWDYEKPSRALASAARCGQSLPAIAHMWHMPGHTFSRLKRYDDAAWQQEASARVDHAHMMRDRVMPDQIHNFAHNNEWLIRNLNHLGRVGDAIDLAKNMIELPRHPNYNTLEKRGSAQYGRTRLLETLSRYELWDQLIALCDTPYLAPTDREEDQVTRLRNLGRAAFRSGNKELGERQLKELQSRLAALKPEPEKKDTEEKENGKKDSDKQPAEACEPEDKEGDAKDKDQDKQDEESKKKEEEEKKKREEEEKKKRRERRNAIRRLEKAIAALEGHRAVMQGEYEEGWKKLKEAGSEDPMHLAKVKLLSGEVEEALKSGRSHVKGHKNEVQPLAKLIELLWFAERRHEAKETFGKLREISSTIDMESPVFRRLAPIAEELGYEADWRQKKEEASDIGERPSLDSLGTFRWQPTPAPTWSLKDHTGREFSLDQFQGQPLLVIFYLGFGCLHCAEQLHEFAPMVEKFEDAGIQLLAVSTDDEAGLKISIANYGGDGLPFPLLSNSELDVFKAYRAFDDFEAQPLHGTYLIDGNGRVRWQDISYEPFMDAEFVLGESKRLLASESSLGPGGE